ncbi:MAG: glycosyltransferase, partial [Leptospiraceae bacterium]|nr:glycosyltransferase [Leptospiraceae bacterium]
MNYPKVSIIIIGLNVEKYIENCISSILNLDYPKDKIEIIYSDSGSKDNTLNIVKKFLEVKIVKLETKEPTPGKGRNAGAKEATGE